MEINRHQWFMIGLIVLALGLQFRLVESYTLSQRSTQFLAERAGKPVDKTVLGMRTMLPSAGPQVRKVVRPPDWLGWALVSTGAVLVLHSLAMPRPD
ncbi:MAG: hypothetical protein K2Y37_08050 [Pirellulales bacterium]|nr:hypothetical protein [Pirellulales bacterium]